MDASLGTSTNGGRAMSGQRIRGRAACAALAVIPALLSGPSVSAGAAGHEPCSTNCPGDLDRAVSILVPLESPADRHRPDAAECSAECRADFDRARSVTAPYEDEDAALRDGFVSTGKCEAEGTPGGAMGIHYLNPARYSPPHQPRVEAPEVLLYIPDGLGRHRLVAVEYAVPVFRDGAPYYGIDPPDPAKVNAPPVLFGHPFDGPMPGHIPGQSWHYDLHVWAWSDNPHGPFAQYNPRESCPSAPLP
jgi:hypothetical protein